jgi:hypothetical protein
VSPAPKSLEQKEAQCGGHVQCALDIMHTFYPVS